MLGRLNSSYRILAKQPPATPDQIHALINHLKEVPGEFIKLVQEATDIEHEHQSEQYVRICGPQDCIETDIAHYVHHWMRGRIPDRRR